MKTCNAMRGASVIAAMLVGVWASSAQANLVLNGGFDTGDFTDWTLFTTPNGSNGPSPLPQVVSFDVTGGGASDAAEFEVGEVTFTALQEGGGIQQTITTVAGIAVMHVDIAAFNISGSDNGEGGVFTLLLDGVPLDSFTTGSITNGTTIRDSLDFTGAITAGNHVLAVQITRDFQTKI